MRIALIVPDGDPNPQYRGIIPMDELAKHGHVVGTAVSPQWTEFPPLESFEGFDLVYFWRMFYTQIRHLTRALQEMGIAVIWDNDVNLAALPSDVPGYREVGGAKGQADMLQMQAMIQMADAVTTPSETLAALYRQTGQEHVHVIENYVIGSQPRMERARTHLVIGWVAGSEHVMDVRRLRLEATFRRVLERRPSVRIVSVGIPLDLPRGRYIHRQFVPLGELPIEIGNFDIGIAPLADTEYNRSRSNVKLKEYAALGLPWLASNTPSYQGLGEEEGGWLLDDDEWFEGILQLVDDAALRRELAARSAAWGRSQTIAANYHRWEAILQETVDRVQSQQARSDSLGFSL